MFEFTGTRSKSPRLRQVQVLVLCPTRELAVQITDNKVLEIRVTPSMGLAGRPSSERIAYAAGAR